MTFCIYQKMKRWSMYLLLCEEAICFHTCTSGHVGGSRRAAVMLLAKLRPSPPPLLLNESRRRPNGGGVPSAPPHLTPQLSALSSPLCFVGVFNIWRFRRRRRAEASARLGVCFVTGDCTSVTDTIVRTWSSCLRWPARARCLRTVTGHLVFF